jgi:hypothetical protein
MFTAEFKIPVNESASFDTDFEILTTEGGKFAAEGGSFTAEARNFAIDVGKFTIDVGKFAIEVGKFAIEVSNLAADSEILPTKATVDRLQAVASKWVAFEGDFDKRGDEYPQL